MGLVLIFQSGYFCRLFVVFKIYFMRVNGLSACIAGYRVHAWYSWRLEEPLDSLEPEQQMVVMAALQMWGVKPSSSEER